MSIDHMGQVRKGMEVRTADGQKLGKVAEIWHGTDPTANNPRCDEDICSRLEVHHGLLERTVLYIPSSATTEVSGKRVMLNVDHAMVDEHDWIKQPGWIAAAAVGLRPEKGGEKVLPYLTGGGPSGD